MVKVSVVIPIYNAEDYLEECLKSVMTQTLKEIEIICVDDGSIDKSGEIIEWAARSDERIIPLSQNNKYAGVARNFGMSVATGEYIVFLDADDYFDSQMLEKAYLCAKNENVDIVIWGGYISSEETGVLHAENFLKEEYIPKTNSFDTSDIANRLFNFTVAAPWNKMYKATFIKENDLRFQEYKRVNDAFFVEMALALSKRIGIVRENLVYYRSGNVNSLQGSNNETPLLFSQVFSDMQDYLKNKGLYYKYHDSFINLALDHCIYNLECMKNADSFSCLFESLRTDIFINLDITEDKKDIFINKNNYEKYIYIMTHSPLEYWMEKYYQSVAINKKSYLFPFGRIKPNSRIVLYAAGKVGREFYMQLKKTKYCSNILWIDKAIRNVEDVRVAEVSGIRSHDFDYVVIAIEKKNVADEIRKSLLENFAIKDEQIVWENPIANNE